MMEDNGNREQTGALPLEGSFPETVPGIASLIIQMPWELLKTLKSLFVKWFQNWEQALLSL